MKPPVYLKLFDKAVAAITSAVEIYNKPGFLYRDSDFKAAKKYHDLRKKLADDTKLYRLRLLDPSNPKGIKKPFYSTNVLVFFDKHYTQK